MTVPPEEVMRIARQHAKKVCWHHPQWDWEDLWGQIMEDCVRWPPKYPAEVTGRAKWATADWFKRNLGKDGEREAVYSAAPFSEFETEAGSEVETLFNADPFADEELRNVTDLESPTLEWAVSVLPARDGNILRLLSLGYSQAEAAELAGTSKATVTRTVNNVIIPLLDLLGLNAPVNDGAAA